MILFTENAAAEKHENYSNDMPVHFYITVYIWTHLSDTKWNETKIILKGGKEKNRTKPNEIINKQKLSFALISEEKLAAESK